MNTLFWIIIAGLLIAAVLLLVWPLLKTGSLTQVDGSQRNLKIARQQLAELKQQLQDGVVTQKQFAAQYLELQQNLDDALQTETNAPAQVGNGRWVIPLVVLFVPLTSLLLYFNLADPEALQKVEIQQANDKDMADVRAMIPQIIAKLKQKPDDLEGWMMLGRSYKFLQQYQEAANVFGKLDQLLPDNLEVMLNYAENLALARNGQLAGKPAELAYRALELAPDDKDALWMASMAKMEEGNQQQAISYLQKLAWLLPSDSSALPQVQQMIAEASAQQTNTNNQDTEMVNITVQVTLDAAIQPQVSPGQTVFIYAQALNGPKMPLAIVRQQVANLPVTVVLNDTQAMQPNLHLADFTQLRIVARISKSGDAGTQRGDYIGDAEISLPVGEQPVSVLINQEVK